MRITPIEMKPYELLGAGRLTSALYKTGDELIGWQYRFNIYRTDVSNGAVSHWLTPNDLKHLISLVHVLCSELLADGCIESDQRESLEELLGKLEAISSANKSKSRSDG